MAGGRQPRVDPQGHHHQDQSHDRPIHRTHGFLDKVTLTALILIKLLNCVVYHRVVKQVVSTKTALGHHCKKLNFSKI